MNAIIGVEYTKTKNPLVRWLPLKFIAILPFP
jgi:hypothetical protein